MLKQSLNRTAALGVALELFAEKISVNTAAIEQV
jgi:hypothetical protein